MNPAHAQHLRLAAQALGRGDTAMARAACHAVLREEPDNADALNLLGLSEAQAGNPAAAIAALERAVAANPGYANAWRNLAALREAAGDPAGASAALAEALARDPRATYDDWYGLGVRAHGAGHPGRAAAAFVQALKQRPDEVAALHNLAVAQYASGRQREARASAERMLACDPGRTASRASFAAIWATATEPAGLQRALDAALAVLATDPGHAGAHDSAAIVLGKSGQAEAALEHAREALRLAPAEPAYAYTLARLADEFGRLDEAEAVLARADAGTVPHPGLRRLVGTIALRRGQPQAAAAALAQALAIAPDDQDAIAQRGLALALAGDPGADAWLGLDRFLTAQSLPVPAPFHDPAEFNAALAADIRRHSQLRYEPVGLAARGGYLTDDLLADPTPSIRGFERALRTAVEAYIAALPPDRAHPFLRTIPARWALNLWATRVAAQGRIDTHLHSGSWLSGAYYVELPPAVGDGGDAAGWIEFGQPHRGLPQLDEGRLRRIRPQVGTLLLFPSYLYHRTLPYEGPGERISVSFDLAATGD
jgi:uncharacterized protein (TIGR02466 family)